MLKKVLSICLSVVIVLGVIAVFCSCGAEQKEEPPKYEYDSQDMSGMIMFELITQRQKEIVLRKVLQEC